MNREFQSALDSCVTVDELIQQLEGLRDQYGRETKVAFGYTANDYWKTPIAQPVEEVEMKVVSYTDYHRTFKVDKENEDEHADDIEIDEESQAKIIVLTSNKY